MDEITQLLNGTTGGNSTPTVDITGMLTQLMLWTILPTIIFGIIFLIVYIMRSIRRRKVENAIFEIRDLLRTMQPPQAIPPVAPEHIATAEQPTENSQTI